MKQKFILLMLIMPAFGYCQKNSNDILTILNKSNVPIVKSFKTIGFLDDNKVKIENIFIERMDNGEKFKGIVFSLNRKESKIYNVLDSSEAVLFKNSLIRLKSKLDDRDFRSNSFELTSTSNFYINAKYLNSDQLWMFVLFVNKLNMDSDFHFGPDGLSELIQRLETSISNF